MFEQAKNIIKNSQKIYIVGHVNPDGDSIGSAYALYFALKSIGKDVKVLQSKRSYLYDFLPSINENVQTTDKEYDLLIAVDSSDRDRLDMSEEDIQAAKKILMIDHHKKSSPYGDVNCIEEELAATSQLVYEFLKYMNLPIDQNIATYLYMGIMTDTGSFNYSCTTSRTLQVAADLISTGINFTEICRKINETMKESKLKLIAKTIDKMEVYYNGQVRYSYIDYDTMSELGVEDEDAEGMTNYLRSVEGTEVAVYVRGKSDGSLKVSMRSAGKVKVSDIAIAFGGGGHARAAGYTMKDEINVGKKKLLEALEVMLK
ncbi:MAG: bifunctional oligoribonuclease/PAP phosphatase NrnA [Clostridia bacterium]|nr:bifunctional oligoribonuclease/PAP phosphatase NrnA [Clostridia bacterium]